MSLVAPFLIEDKKTYFLPHSKPKAKAVAEPQIKRLYNATK